MTLPRVADRRVDGDEAVIALLLPADHAAFAGHFPGRPVLAGVLQIDWAMRFAAQCFVLDQTAAQDFQVKFRRIIGPDENLSLVLRLDRQRASDAFEYRSAGEIATSGKIRLEPQP